MIFIGIMQSHYFAKANVVNELNWCVLPLISDRTPNLADIPKCPVYRPYFLRHNRNK